VRPSWSRWTSSGRGRDLLSGRVRRFKIRSNSGRLPPRIQRRLQELAVRQPAICWPPAGVCSSQSGSGLCRAQNWRQTALVAFGLPFALVGGVYGLWLRGLPLTMPAAIGFVTLGGLSILNGMVLMTYFNDLRAQGVDTGAAALHSAKRGCARCS
jgi:hypothetical protein